MKIILYICYILRDRAEAARQAQSSGSDKR